MAIPEGVKITPWIAQYQKWKAEYPDALLLFRMGDFYELFFDDAKEASVLLDIALTAKDATKNIPMAGIPYHALNSYLGRLIKAGRHVAICEQIGEPDGRTVVERRVIRVVTPGTYVPEESENTGHLAAVMPAAGRTKGSGKHWALALLSAETGSLEAGTLTEGEAVSLLSAFSPGEVLFPSNVKQSSFPAAFRDFTMLPQPAEVFKTVPAAIRLKSLLLAQRLESYGIAEDDPAVGPARAVLDYLSATQFSDINYVLNVHPLRSCDYLYLDEAAQKNLDLVPDLYADKDSSLFSCLNRCHTPMGRRTLRSWLLRPLLDIAAIGRRQDCVGCLVEDRELLSELQDRLAETRDVERSLSRLCLGTGTPKDIAAIRDTLRVLPAFHELDAPEPLRGLLQMLPDVKALRDLLESALEDEIPRALGMGPVIRSSFSEQLASWRQIHDNGDAWLTAYLEKEREATGSPRLKTGYNKVFGYYLEIGRTGLEKIPDYYERRQTLVNAERFVTQELREFQEKMGRSEGEITSIEAQLYNEVREKTVAERTNIQLSGRMLGTLDCLASLADIAAERGYVKPEVNDSHSLVIRGGRHPVLETAASATSFVPNDVTLGGEAARIAILTGPNMAGKSTWLRMTALLTIMAQSGSWIPAESASFGLIDRVFTRIGARDDLVRGNSTFMVEMLETAGILNNLSDRSLVILDEIGRGTSTWDGMSIAWAVLEYLHGGCGTTPKVLFATHYHELTCLEERLDSVKNFSMAVSEGENGILFLHQVVERPADRSYGIEVARLAGLPKTVLRRAFELLELFESEGFERSALPPVPAASHVSEQLPLFPLESDAIIEELSELDTDNLTPMRSLEILYKMKEKAKRARNDHGN